LRRTVTALPSVVTLRMTGAGLLFSLLCRRAGLENFPTFALLGSTPPNLHALWVAQDLPCAR
jgi:hypothetical protein